MFDAILAEYRAFFGFHQHSNQLCQNNDVAYLMFVSGESANGYPGETEIARIGLGPFQELWKKVIQD